MTRRRDWSPQTSLGKQALRLEVTTPLNGFFWISNAKELSAIILGLDPRIHLSTGLRVRGRDNTNVATLATGRQPLNHPASR